MPLPRGQLVLATTARIRPGPATGPRWQPKRTATPAGARTTGPLLLPPSPTSTPEATHACARTANTTSDADAPSPRCCPRPGPPALAHDPTDATRPHNLD